MTSETRRLGRVGVWSRGIARIPHIRALLGADDVVLWPSSRARVDAVVGWGRKPNTEPARRYAAEHGVPFFALEDGFLRSFSPGVTGDPPLSIVIDAVGIHYDATQPSEIEQRLARIDALPETTLDRARRAMAFMRREHLSKYNDAPSRTLGERTRPRVLVVDQTAGDLSISLGMCVPRAFDRMLEAALDENPDAEIVVKTHPDVVLGKKNANFASIPRDPRVRLFGEPSSAMALLDEVDRVYVATSQLGLEALIAGKRVTCFGVPFYAGWGLTDDRAPVPDRRGASRTIEHVFAEAYLHYARYVDPETGAPCEHERVAEHLALQRRTAQESGEHLVCVGFSPWRRAFAPRFVGAPMTRVDFASDARAAESLLNDRSRIVIWGSRANDDVRALADRRGVPLVRVEDGFLRSVGLGSDLNAPASLVFDDRGIYFDPRSPSALETILETADFDHDELERARDLRARIVRAGISKYNVGARTHVGPRERGERRVVLVVGQVEDDASIRLGCIDVRSNEALLREARSARPDAYVIWKPHPDVVRGNRAGAVDPARASAWADEIVEDATLADCLAVADEVHTMTSLVGFEALLRGLRVVVYGQPFYAGWGLTEDRHPHPRRTRRRTLDELVAATLLRYPRYVSAASNRLTTPERVVDELLDARAREPAPSKSAWARRELGKAANLARTLLGRPTTKAEPSNVDALRALGFESALLMQGPAGPFFRRFGEDLRAAGIRTTKINFHAGDELFYRGPDAITFRGQLAELRGFLGRVIDERAVDAIFVFGDCRAHHRVAREIARERSLALWVFEEGYLRPDWITLERDGVNGYSNLPRDPDVYRRARLPEPPVAAPVGDSFGRAAWYHTVNALTCTFGNHRFPHYRHHHELNAFKQAFAWVRGAARKQWYLQREAHLLERIAGPLSGRFFLVALQVHFDFQLMHSRYRDVTDFVEEVVREFARHADPRDSLVLKHHPMDRPFREYGALMERLRREHGLGDRLIYVHDLHLPTMLKHTRGCIAINSTTALQAFHHGAPVKVTGTAVYDMPGLTFQGSLGEFFRDPGTFDRELYESFRRWLLWENQLNGNFYVRLRGRTKGSGVAWRATRSAHVELAHGAER
ncbi:hypothetical protein [Sandaracinus amylolyticus]|uniref:Capsular polysaccharide export system protein KpsS n=1 Tax=Sandaracinus amylolyticus TaxID=927083 RepID=A0A0F6W7V8_9BACT|nr:hypothetical protein [Sandaracinus amylolyticus]AKF09661.1 Capsular polysaccharide export system protein KpsS [Sandaracinus amylolyticus]